MVMDYDCLLHNICRVLLTAEVILRASKAGTTVGILAAESHAGKSVFDEATPKVASSQMAAHVGIVLARDGGAVSIHTKKVWAVVLLAGVDVTCVFFLNGCKILKYCS